MHRKEGKKKACFLCGFLFSRRSLALGVLA
jgi:hypothetical protein